jgi:hypothetical protein
MPPKIVKVPEYGQSWWMWWKTLQPEWRGMGEGKLSRQVLEGEKWSQTCRGGANGFLMIVLTLAWWIVAAEQNSEQCTADADLHLAMEDVKWVLDRMVMLINSEGILATGMKRSLDNTAALGDVAVKKR